MLHRPRFNISDYAKSNNQVKKYFLIFLLGFVYCSTFKADARSLKLTSWNIEWLVSSQDSFSLPEDIVFRQKKDFDRLASYVKQLNADIIGLQEIGSIATLQQLFPADNYQILLTNDSIPQHVGLAIRKGLHFERHPDLTALNVYRADAHHPLRSGLDITLYEFKIPLRLLIIHLKSGCQDYPLDKSSHSCPILKTQLLVVKNWIQERIKNHEAFILMGDFNRVLSQQDPFFKTLSSDIPLFMPSFGFANPCWRGSFFIDGFLISDQARTFIVPNSLRVMIYKEQDRIQKNLLSDHCPVSIKLQGF